MADTVPGTLKVSNDVIADLAGYAAYECYGVVGMAFTDAQHDPFTALSLSQMSKGVDVAAEDGKVLVTLHVIVDLTVNMLTVTRNLVSSVEFILKRIAQIDNAEVHVVVEDVRAHHQPR